MDTQKTFLYLILFHFIFSSYESKIIRVGHKFLAQFSLVDSNSRIKANCIGNITKFTTHQECSGECAQEKNCQSFNRHKLKGFCELLSISKFDESGLLRRNFDWTHYETDDDEQNVGHICTQLSPCKSYEICEETLINDPAYTCRCRNGFHGDKCQNYTGPGFSESNPAASCHLLLLKFKSVPDGDYWFKGKQKAIKCERRVDGGYTHWSSFGTCTEVICGKQERNRSCTNPKPKGGGRSCVHLGPDIETKRCYSRGYSEEICADCSLDLFSKSPISVKMNNFIGTFGSLLKEYSVQLEFKVNLNSLTRVAQFYNIFHFSRGQTSKFHDGVGERMPALWIYKEKNDTIKLHFVTTLNGNSNYITNIIREPSFFNNWIKVKILQQKIGEKYVYKVELNGEVEIQEVNNRPIEFQNMKFYVSNPLSNVSPDVQMKVKKMNIQGYCKFTQESGYHNYLSTIN